MGKSLNQAKANAIRYTKKKVEHWQLVSLALAGYDAISIIIAFFLALWFRFDCRYSMIPKEFLGAYLKFIGIYASAISTLVASLFLYLYRKYRMKSYFNAYEKNDIGIQVTFVFFFIAFYVNNQILNILTVIISLLTSIIINFKTICRFLKKLRIYAR